MKGVTFVYTHLLGKIRMAEKRRPLYAIIMKIDIESDWNTSIKDGSGVCILNLVYFWNNF